LDIDDGVEVPGVRSWHTGERIPISVATPIELEATPKGRYHGLPVEMRDGNLLLMSERLVKALREAGVDNLDCYAAIIRNVRSNETYDYHVVNIIGVISAADIAKSEATIQDSDPRFGVSFESLALQPEAARGALLFRLSENINAIVVEESVRNHLISTGIDTLTFLEPEEWMQL